MSKQLFNFFSRPLYCWFAFSNRRLSFSYVLTLLSFPSFDLFWCCSSFFSLPPIWYIIFIYWTLSCLSISMMFNINNVHDTICFISGLAVSSFPIACTLLKSNLPDFVKFFRRQELVAPSQSSFSDKIEEHNAAGCHSKYPSSRPTSTIKAESSDRTGIITSFATLGEVTGLFASLTACSSMGVFTRENVLKRHYGTLVNELNIPPLANYLQLCEERTGTNSSPLSDVSFGAAESKPKINTSRFDEAETLAINTCIQGTKVSNNVSAQPLRALQSFAPNALAGSSIHRFPSLMKACLSLEQPRRSHVTNTILFPPSRVVFEHLLLKSSTNNVDAILEGCAYIGSTAVITEPIIKKVLLQTLLSTLFIPWLLAMSKAVIFKRNVTG